MLVAEKDRAALIRWSWRLVLAVLLVWAAVNLMLVYQHFVLPKPPLHWDEASHGLQGLVIAQDVLARDVLGLLYDSYRQVYWPPVFSWISGFVFLGFGATTETARLSSLIWLLPLPFVLLLAGGRVSRRRPLLVGLIAASLTLASVSLADMSSYAMLEAPGILAFSVGLWLYLRLLDRPTVPGAISLGLAMVVTYLTKSNYGVLLVLGVVIERLLHARLNPWLAFWEAPGRYAFSTLGAGLLLWFAYPPKLRNSLAALVNSPYGPVDAYSLDGFLYYPRALGSMIGPAWLIALTLIAVALSLTRLSNPRLRLLIVLVVMQMAFATWSVTKLERHIAPMLPPLFLLTSYWLAWLAQRFWAQSSPWSRAVAVLAPLLVLAGSSHAFYSDVFARPSGPGNPASYALVRELAELSRNAGPLLVASTVDAYPPQFDWYLATEGRMPIFSAGSLKEHDEAQWRALNAISPAVAGAFAHLPDRSRRTDTTRSLYSGLPMDRPELLTEKDYASGVMEMAMAYRLPAIVLVKTPEAGHLYEKRVLEEELTAGGYQLVFSKEYGFQPATVVLYTR